MNTIKIEIKQTVLHLIFRVVVTTFFLGLIGCGGGGGGSNSSDLTNNNNSLTKATTLADANVAIYKVKDDGSLSLLWKEKTSSGKRLEEIGKFNLHTNELTDDDFYLYKVTGGKDWDSDKNGILDGNFTINKGILRSIAQGIDIKKAGDNFKISYTTELFYEEVVPTLKRKFDRATFPSILNNKVSKIIEDSNDIQDILTFNPIEDKSKLKEFYKIRARKIVNDIHQGKIPALNMSAILGTLDINTSEVSDVALSNDGTKAYIAEASNGLVVVDISDPTNPIKLSSYDRNCYSVTISKDNTKAYIGTYKGLVIVDISEPTYLTKIGSFEIEIGEVFDIRLSNDGTKAYVLNGNGLIIIDISNPTNPIKLGLYNIKGKGKAITISDDGTKAYIVDNFNHYLEYYANSSLLIIDISNPTHPIKLNSYNMKDYVYGITLSNDGTKAYIIMRSIGLIIIDISDPINPTKLSSLKTVGPPIDIMLSNDNTKAYIISDIGLVVVDISDPTNPIKLGFYNTGGYNNSIILSSDSTKAYVMDKSNGLLVVDISNPINPPKLGSYSTGVNINRIRPSTGHAETYTERLLNSIKNQSSILNFYSIDNATISKINLSSDGTKAYILSNISKTIDIDDGNFIVLDISNPSNPTKLGSYNTEDHFKDVTFSNDGTKAYLVKKHFLLENGTINIIKIISSLVMLDISNPTNPIQIGSYVWEGDVSTVTLSKDGTKVYMVDKMTKIGTYNSSLIVIDASNPNNLTKLGSYSWKGNDIFIDIALNGNKAYLTDYLNGLMIIDISNSSNLSELSSYNKEGEEIVGTITLSNDGEKAYIGDNNGLVILDISNPINPTKLGSYNTIGSVQNTILSNDGTKIYIADGNNGIIILDISDPTNPIELATYNVEGYITDIKLSNDETKAYVADIGNGLIVIDLDLYN